jgi:hypothetical protein
MIITRASLNNFYDMTFSGSTAKPKRFLEASKTDDNCRVEQKPVVTKDAATMCNKSQVKVGSEDKAVQISFPG